MGKAHQYFIKKRFIAKTINSDLSVFYLYLFYHFGYLQRLLRQLMEHHMDIGASDYGFARCHVVTKFLYCHCYAMPKSSTSKISVEPPGMPG